jgi:hypothetical protein
MEDIRNAYTILVAEVEEEKPLRTPRHRLVDNIKTDVR